VIKLRHDHAELDEDTAETLATGVTKLPYTVEVHPPRDTGMPSTLQRFTQGILEYQTRWLGLKNASPTISYEIRRSTPKQVKIQYSAPTKRLERKIRTQLTNEIPDVKFSDGATGLPVVEGDKVGGGLLTAGRQDCYPFKKEFDNPPMNSVVSALHRHAMRDTKVVIQVLFRPVIGKPLRRYYWRKRAYQRLRYLRKEKEKLWGSRPATPREKRQADQIERKAGTPRFHVLIRILVIGAGEHTPSRVKELSGPFNNFENPDTGQYLNTTTITPIRKTQLLNFAEAVNSRKYRSWSQSFQASTEELAALLSIPSHRQQNIQYAEP
jgi:hypothetical protein